MHILSSSSFQLNNICNNLDNILLRYKNVSKTDVSASWIQHPKRDETDVAFLCNKLNAFGQFSG